MIEQEVLQELEEKLKNAYEHWGFERMQPTKVFILERSKQWETVTKIPYYEIISRWLDNCSYSMINYFQETNQPALDNKTKIFNTIDDFHNSVGEKGFRCPYCGGVSSHPYECNSGLMVKLSNKKGKHPCNWKAYGLFGTIGKGSFVFVKEGLNYSNIFMPIAWEGE